MTQLPTHVLQLLRAVEFRRCCFDVIKATAYAVVLLAIGMALVALIDGLLKPGPSLRLWLSAAAYAGPLAILVVGCLRPLLRPRQLADSARFIEAQTTSDLEQRLSAAVELANQPTAGVGRWMIERTIALAAHDADSLRPSQIVSYQQIRQPVIRGAIAGLMLLIALAIPGLDTLMHRALLPTTNIIRPATTTLSVEPGGDVKLLRGESFTVVVQVEPTPADAEIEVEWEDGLIEILPLRSSDDGQFERTLNDLTQSLRWQVRAGDAESHSYQVDLVSPPRLEELQVRVEPQPYTGLAPALVPGGNADVLAGSRCVVEAKFAGDHIDAATIVFGRQSPRRVPVEDGWLRAEITPDHTMSYGIGLDDTTIDLQWTLHVTPDEPPAVTLSGPALTYEFVAPDELLSWNVVATDDIGLRELGSEWQLHEQATARRLPHQVQPDQLATAVERDNALNLAHTSATIGDEIKLRGYAIDYGGQKTNTDFQRWLIVDTTTAANAQLAQRLALLRDQLLNQYPAVRSIATQWSQLRVNQDDQADEAAQLHLLIQSQDQLSDRLAHIALAIDQAALEEGGSYAGHTTTVAQLLHQEVDNNLKQLRSLIQTVPTASPETIDGSHVTIDRLQSGLDQVDHWLGLLLATLHAEQLDVVTESQVGRVERIMPVVRGYRGWESKAAQPGLVASFYQRDQPGGEPSHQAIMAPQLQNYRLPQSKTKRWSVRFEGDIYIPSAGDWHFNLDYTDGARLSIHGKPQLAGKAWSAKTKQLHSELLSLPLEAGWHPIRLEHRRRSDYQRLKLSYGPDANTLNPVLINHTRNHGTNLVDASLVEAMSRLDASLAEQAHQHLMTQAQQLVTIPTTIQTIIDLAAEPNLVDYHQRATVQSEQLRDGLETNTSELSLHQLQQVGALAPALRTTTSSLFKDLHDLISDLAKRQPMGTGPLVQLRQQTIAAENLAEDVEQAMKDDAPDRQLLAATLNDKVAELEQALDQTIDHFRDQARQADANLAQRVAHVNVARELEDEALEEIEKARKAVNDLAATNNSDRQSQAARAAERALDKLDHALSKAQNVAKDLSKANEAQFAEQALAAIGRRDLARATNDALSEEAALSDLNRALNQLETSSRQRGDDQDTAEIVETRNQMAQGHSDHDLREALMDRSRRAFEQAVRDDIELDRQFLEQLKPDALARAARSSEPDSSAAALRTLEHAAVDLAVAIEQQQQQHKRKNNDMATLERLSDQVTRALESTQEATTTPSTAPTSVESAQAVAQLASQAKAAEASEAQRHALRQHLQALVGKEPTVTASPAELLVAMAQRAEDRSQQLAQLHNELQHATEAERAALQTFAADHQRVAEQWQARAEDARHITSTNQALQQAITTIAQQGAEHQQITHTLAEQARHSNTTMATRQLTTDAQHAAQAVQRQVAQPLAAAYRQAARTAEPSHMEAAAKLGTAVAELAHIQDQSSRQLAMASEQRQQVADQLARAEQAATQQQKQLTQALTERGESPPNEAPLSALAEQARRAATATNEPTMQPPAPPAVSTVTAAEQALAAIEQAPNERSSYRHAADLLTAATSQHRLAAAITPPSASDTTVATDTTSNQNIPSTQNGLGRGNSGSITISNTTIIEGDSEWASLPERLRQRIRGGNTESFGKEHREAIDAYFERIAESQ